MYRPAWQLHNALCRGDNRFVNEVINRHGGFNKVVDEDGFTALHFAARSGEVEILQKIWKMFKPDINQKDEDGNTPLHHASYYGELPSVQWCVGHGSDPQAISNENETAKDRAKDGLGPHYHDAGDEDGDETETVDFLYKVESMKKLFPVKEVSPLNYFSIRNYAEELEEYLTNVGTDDPEVIDYLYLFYVFMKSSTYLHFTYLIDLLPIHTA